MRVRIADGDRGIEVDGKRHEPGDVVDLPENVIDWLRGKGLIDDTPPPAKRGSKPVVETVDIVEGGE